jgi:DNA-binding ferritin-like protein
MRISDTRSLRGGVLDAPTDLEEHSVDQFSSALRELHNDAIALSVKTRNVHWHIAIACPQAVKDSDEELVRTMDMLAELCLGFEALTRSVRAAGRLTTN